MLPEAFGRFRDNLVLHRCVCTDCNRYFSRELELPFARGSIESLIRVAAGVKPAESVENLRRDRLAVALAEDGNDVGMRLGPMVENGRVVLGPIAQVGFRKADESGWVYVTEEELSRPAWKVPENANTKLGIKILMPDDEETRRRITKLLKSRGISFEMRGTLPLQSPREEMIAIDVTARIDTTVRRCVAKIAFNYLTFVAGRDFVLDRNFDAIRAYVRHDRRPPYVPVRINNQPILADDTEDKRQTNGHLIILDWADSEVDLLCKLSLFNNITYWVLLCADFIDSRKEVRSGHHFDVDERRVFRLRREPKGKK